MTTSYGGELTDNLPGMLAGAVLDTLPLIMRLVRPSKGHYRTTAGLSVPQFRGLALIYHHPDVSLSEIAEHVGMGLPSASKMIEGLVERKLVVRSESQEDRRRKEIRITAEGRRVFEEFRKKARQVLAKKLETLTNEEAESVKKAMEILRTQLSKQEGHAGNEHR
jgi:MarR family transcriptional regulator for hemolysin